jgi:hypothetical protein
MTDFPELHGRRFIAVTEAELETNVGVGRCFKR